MISYNRDPQQTIPTSSVKIIGLGGGGANILERVALDGMEGAELLALNTDVRTLQACVAGEKIQLGRNLTRGLGTGGDPELGQQSMLEAETEIRDSLRGRRIVFLCVGLGGGTGSGAAPMVTRIAREEGAFVVVFATMPFAFEGKRRRDQAETALNELAVLANALVTFDNNRMGELVLARQGIHEAFSAADHMICESIKAVIRLVIRPGLINVGLDDLMSALRTNRSRCLFGSGIAEGKDRAARALRNALSSPLLDQGALLKDAETVLVHLSGGEDVTLYEIELLMQRLQKFVPETAHVLFGAAIDPAMKDQLSITLISALPEDHLSPNARPRLSNATENPILDPAEDFAVSAEEPSTPFIADFNSEPEPDIEPEIEASGPEPEEAAPQALFFDDDTPFGEAFADPVPEGETAYEESPPREQEAETVSNFQPEPEDDNEPFTFRSPPIRLEPVEEPADSAPRSSSLFSTEPAKPRWGTPKPKPQLAAGGNDFPPDLDDPAPEPRPEPPKLKLGVKSPGPQIELSFDSVPRGRFEGASPNVVNGEDLDLPPFLRKKR